MKARRAVISQSSKEASSRNSFRKQGHVAVRLKVFTDPAGRAYAPSNNLSSRYICQVVHAKHNAYVGRACLFQLVKDCMLALIKACKMTGAMQNQSSKLAIGAGITLNRQLTPQHFALLARLLQAAPKPLLHCCSTHPPGRDMAAKWHTVLTSGTSDQVWIK